MGKIVVRVAAEVKQAIVPATVIRRRLLPDREARRVRPVENPRCTVLVGGAAEPFIAKLLCVDLQMPVVPATESRFAGRGGKRLWP